MSEKPAPAEELALVDTPQGAAAAYAAADYAERNRYGRAPVLVLHVLWCAVRWLCWDSWRHALEEQRKEND